MLRRHLEFEVGRSPAPLLLLALIAGLIVALLPLGTSGGAMAISGLSFVALLWPLAGLGAALLAGPWGALEAVRGGGLLDTGQQLLLLTIAGWVALSLRRRQVVIPRSPLNIPLTLFLTVALLSLGEAPSLRAGLLEIVKWVEILLVLWLVVDLAGRRAGGVRLVTGLVLLAGLTQAIIGIWQFGLRGIGPAHFIILGRFYRAYGTFEQPNPFGGYMSMTAVLAVGCLVGLLAAADRQRWRQPSYWLAPWPLLVLVTAGAATLAVGLSWSRGAWLGFGAAVATLAFFLSPRRRLGIMLLLLGIVGGGLLWEMGLVPDTIAGRLTGFLNDFQLADVRGAGINPENYAVLERLAHWQAALEMARTNPWLGTGFGNYAAAYPEFALVNWPDALGHAHNYYLNLLSEVGAVGLLVYLVLWLAIVGQTARALQRQSWPARGIALGLMAVWATMTIHHLVDKLYVNNLYISLGAMLGVLQLLDRPDAASQVTSDDS